MNMIPPPTVINNDHRQYGVVSGIVVLASLASAFTLLRLHYRYTSRAIGHDDYAIIPAFVGRNPEGSMLNAHEIRSCTWDGRSWPFMLISTLAWVSPYGR